MLARMAKLDLRIRDLKTGETLHAAFESEEDARAWLADRPQFTEVMGVATHGLATEVYNALRAVVRPLDDEEKAFQKQLAAAEEQVDRERMALEDRIDRAEVERHKQAMRTADPDRPMMITWTYDLGVRSGDPLDPREVTEVAREAVLAWVRERDEWVKDRGQMVGEANVTVWPGALPHGETERVQRGGVFYPTTAPTTPAAPGTEGRPAGKAV